MKRAGPSIGNGDGVASKFGEAVLVSVTGEERFFDAAVAR